MSTSPISSPSAPGSLAPATTLLQADGRPLELATLWSRRPLLLIFLRHVGCAVCRAHLHLIRDAYGQLQAAGAGVAAVARALPATLPNYALRNRLPFPVLADPSGDVYARWGFAEGSSADSYGAQVLMAQAREALRGNLPYVAPGTAVHQLGGTVIVDRQGALRFHHLARPIYLYPSLEDYLAVLQQLRDE